ncbi:MAG: hypothetical protein RMM07_11910 [Anaerolineae bacterium]|nr:hypothetical protein [Anaerolineae bacterium]
MAVGPRMAIRFGFPWPSLPVVVLGGTGSGKSAFLMNVVEAALAQGG